MTINPHVEITAQQIYDGADGAANLFAGIKTHAPGPEGMLPITPEMLLTQPSGNLFGLSQSAGMGWEPARLLDPEFLILSTHGGMRAQDGTPIALGFHTGHWEVGLLVAEAARELRNQHCIPYAGACTDPCDGRTQGTDGMLDSLPYRNDAAIVLRRLMRSLPTRKGVIGVATCDKGLPAMMMALASSGSLPSVLIPGGVTLLPEAGEDAGKVQSIGARFAQRQITLEYAAEIGCRACATPGGGCQFLGTAATSQVVAEALGLSLPHAALAPSGQPLWLDAAARSARAILRMTQLDMGPATYSRTRLSGMPWCSTPPLVDRPTCCSTFRLLPMLQGCDGRPQPIGPRSIARFPGLSTRCQMVRIISLPSRCFSQAECLKSCCIFAAPACSIARSVQSPERRLTRI